MSPVQDNVFSDDFLYLIFHFYGVFVRWVSILYYDYSLFINENFTSLCKHQWTVFKHIKLWKLLKITTVWGKHSCEALVYQKTGFVVLVLLKNIRWSDVGTNVCYQKSGERILQRRHFTFITWSHWRWNVRKLYGWKPRPSITLRSKQQLAKVRSPVTFNYEI